MMVVVVVTECGGWWSQNITTFSDENGGCGGMVDHGRRFCGEVVENYWWMVRIVMKDGFIKMLDV